MGRIATLFSAGFLLAAVMASGVTTAFSAVALGSASARIAAFTVIEIVAALLGGTAAAAYLGRDGKTRH